MTTPVTTAPRIPGHSELNRESIAIAQTLCRQALIRSQRKSALGAAAAATQLATKLGDPPPGGDSFLNPGVHAEPADVDDQKRKEHEAVDDRRTDVGGSPGRVRATESLSQLHSSKTGDFGDARHSAAPATSATGMGGD